MKKLLFFSVILQLFVLISCNNDSSTTSQTVATGQWKLINVQGGIPGSNYDFTPGLIIWDFDAVNHLVTVENNNTDTTAIDYFETGSYIFQTSFIPNAMGCGETVTFDDGAGMACIYIENEKLIINSLINDSFKLTFIH